MLAETMGLQRALTGAGTLPRVSNETFPLNPSRRVETAQIAQIVTQPEVDRDISSTLEYQTLHAAATGDQFLDRIPQDPQRHGLLVVRWLAMEGLAIADYSRFSSDSRIRQTNLIEAAQARITTLYPDITEALLHPDTGISAKWIPQRVIEHINRERPPFPTLLAMTNYAQIDPKAYDAIYALYFENIAQQKHAELSEMAEEKPLWSWRLIEERPDDGTVRFVERYIDETAQRRKTIIDARNEALIMHMRAGGFQPGMKVGDAESILDDIRRGRYGAQEVCNSETVFEPRIAA